MLAGMMAGGAGLGAVIGAFAKRPLMSTTIGTLGVGFTAKKFLDTLQQGTAFTNPMFNNTGAQAYGKRGIDANNLNTNGLVQSLHKNRRRF